MNLRLPELQDENVLRKAHQELETELEGSDFLLEGYHPALGFEEYIQRVQNSHKGVNLREGRVKATFLVLEIGGDIVGRVSIRHELNEWLSTYGGHIGYAVRPEFRRKGYAKLLLGEGLKICSSLGIDHALLTCKDSNFVSAKVIEFAGGVLENIVPGPDGLLRRYWAKTNIG